MSDQPQNGQEEVSVDLPGGAKFKARGSDILTTIFGVATMCGFTIMIYGGFQHMAEASKDANSITAALKEQSQIQRDQLNAQRESNCLARLTPEQRKRQDEIDFCRALGKGR